MGHIGVGDTKVPWGDYTVRLVEVRWGPLGPMRWIVRPLYLSCTVLIAKNTFDNKTTKNKLREKSYLFTNNSEITNKT